MAKRLITEGAGAVEKLLTWIFLKVAKNKHNDVIETLQNDPAFVDNVKELAQLKGKLEADIQKKMKNSDYRKNAEWFSSILNKQMK